VSLSFWRKVVVLGQSLVINVFPNIPIHRPTAEQLIALPFFEAVLENAEMMQRSEINPCLKHWPAS